MVWTLNRNKLARMAAKLPIVRGAFYEVPPYHVGSVFENRAGLQVFRMISRNSRKALARVDSSPDLCDTLSALDRDGIAVIENFLNADSFAATVDEFRRATENVPLEAYKGVAGARLYRSQIAVGDGQFPVIEENFLRNARLDRIAAAVIRRRSVKRPQVFLDTYQCLNEAGIENDIENVLHADLHLPTVKMFFYLTKTDSTNGAFVYAKGSHRVTLARLRHEYDLSIREARLRRGLSVPAELTETRADETRNIIRPRHRQLMCVTESQICVEPNTLVIANNAGFHRRGEFLSADPRMALLINYRNSEPAL